MGRKCNLELRLSLTSSADDDDGGGGEHKPQCLTSGPSNNQHQWITILHNGQISVCDVTELQAKAIIWRASHYRTCRKKMDQCAKNYEDRRFQVSVHSSGWKFSMKKSLQKFLQKRNKSIISTSLYYER